MGNPNRAVEQQNTIIISGVIRNALAGPIWICGLAALAILSACGGGGGGSASTSTSSPTSIPASTPTTPTPTSSPLPSVSTAEISGLQATVDATNINYQFQYSGTPSFFRLYLDTDKSFSTGYSIAGKGADYLIENGNLYRYSGSAGSWGWSLLKSVTYANANSIANWTVAHTDIGSPSITDIIGQVESPQKNSAVLRHVIYSPSTATFANPERGFYRYQGNCDSTSFNLATLQNYRTNDGATLIMCIFYLENFKTASVNQATLDFFQSQMQTIRAAGLKAIVRFAYTPDPAGVDASPAQVTAHLDQFAPYLQTNSDVIYVVQAGIVGAWGEWYYTQNFGDAGNISASDWANRKAVVDKLLQVVPANRMVQLRTPRYKRTMYTPTELQSNDAFNGSAVARLGHHNDCFLARWNDQGTYIDPAVEYPYLETETKYLPMGGETCEVNPPRSDCATALDELGRFHWSYLNTDYHQTVLDSWNTGGCMNEVKQRLGYRFSLRDSSFPAAAHPNDGIDIKIKLDNQGWASPFNSRNIELVLRDTTTGNLVRIPLAADPRRWLPGQAISLDQTITIPASIPSGTYAVMLNLSDPAPALQTRAEYAIQFANINVWEPATGFNDLFQSIDIAP